MVSLDTVLLSRLLSIGTPTVPSLCPLQARYEIQVSQGCYLWFPCRKTDALICSSVINIQVLINLNVIHRSHVWLAVYPFWAGWIIFNRLFLVSDLSWTALVSWYPFSSLKIPTRHGNYHLRRVVLHRIPNTP